MNKPKGGGYVRVKDRTQLAIQIIQGLQQYETGGRVIADDIVWEALKARWPKETNRALEELRQSGSNDNGGNSAAP